MILGTGSGPKPSCDSDQHGNNPRFLSDLHHRSLPRDRVWLGRVREGGGSDAPARTPGSHQGDVRWLKTPGEKSLQDAWRLFFAC